MTEAHSVSQQEATALHAEARRLAFLLAASERVLASEPLEGSLVDKAYKAGLHEQYHLAYGLIAAAEDHLRTILQIVEVGPLPMYALYTLLRAAGEADVRCRHLLDPRATPKVRLGRALNERLDNLEELGKGLPAKKRALINARVAHLEQRAIANGVAAVRSKPKDGGRARIIGFGEAKKSEIELFAEFFSAGSRAFRFLSGYTHSKPWIWLQRDRVERSTSPDVLQVRIDLDVVRFAELFAAVLDLHEENLGLWLSLSGHPRRSLRQDDTA